MTRPLSALSILVIEDDYLISRSLRDMLHEGGAAVLGPVGYLDEAIRAAATESHIDVALVDVNLHGEASYPAVDVLLARGVRVIFMTGYGAEGVRPAYASCQICHKPYTRNEIIAAITRDLAKDREAPGEGGVNAPDR